MLDLSIHDDKQLTIKYFDMDDGRRVNKKQNFEQLQIVAKIFDYQLWKQIAVRHDAV